MNTKIFMDWLNGTASVASLVGLVVSLYTLYKVSDLASALKQQSRHKQLLSVIDKMTRTPPDKARIAESLAREIEVLLKAVWFNDVTSIPFRQRHLKFLLMTLEAELRGKRQLEVIRTQLILIHDEITLR